MNKEKINLLVRSGVLRQRYPDKHRIKSIIESAETNAKVAQGIAVNEDSATLIFREIYESIRQLGDACWWQKGFEPRNHEISMDVLKELNIKNKLLLNHVGRFKKMRNDANYRGFKVSVEQAKEILTFWKKCSSDIIEVLTNG